MPVEIDRRAFFQLSLLLLAVPIQYYLGNLTSSSEEKKVESLHSIWSHWQTTRIYFTGSWPVKNCVQVISHMISSVLYPDGVGDDDSPSSVDAATSSDDGESPALEVLKKKYSWSDTGYFASAMEPRYPRPSKIKFRIGQVIKHKQYGYRGVIVGWDEVAKAPDEWLKNNHGDNQVWRKDPNYAVLIDIRDRTIPQLGYVPEENIELAPAAVRITHPGMEDYFEAYDGAQYLPRPWLKSIYPMDT